MIQLTVPNLLRRHHYVGIIVTGMAKNFKNILSVTLGRAISKTTISIEYEIIPPF